MNKQTAENLMKITKESYQKIALNFSATRNFSWAEIDRAIEKYLRSGVQILDLGCGNGRLLKSLEKLDSFSYLGLDNCSAFINKAQGMQEIEKPKIEKLRKKIKFIQGDILDLKKINNHTFDVIFMMASLNHIPSQELREKLLLDISRILKPGGFLIMTNWNLWQISAKKSVWHYFLSSSRKRGSQCSWRFPIRSGMTMRDIITLWQNRSPLYYHAFTLKELKKLLRMSGFKVLENYYVKQGQKKYWWNGNNILTVGQKI